MVQIYSCRLIHIHIKLKKKNKIDKLLGKLTITKRVLRLKIRDIKGTIITNSKEMQKIIRSYIKDIPPIKSKNLKEMARFLDAYDLPK